MRPDGMSVDLIVLHAISLPWGDFGTECVDDLFLGKLECAAHSSFSDLQNLKVSAHFVINREGDITQFVPCGRRAWHAGESEWQGKSGCNDFSIGIEIIGDEQQPFTAVQYRETARLCRALMKQYPAISSERIVGHQDVAPGRKWDPGRLWDWQWFRRALAGIRNVDLNIR